MFHVWAADIDLQQGDIRDLIQLFTALHVFLNGKTADIGNNGFLKALAEFWYFLTDNLIHTGIL